MNQNEPRVGQIFTRPYTNFVGQVQTIGLSVILYLCTNYVTGDSSRTYHTHQTDSVMMGSAGSCPCHYIVSVDIAVKS